jgi:hypothetical protein
VRGGLVRDAQRLQPLLEKGARAFAPLGSGRSAMFVTLRGTGAMGKVLERRWELRAIRRRGCDDPVHGVRGACAKARPWHSGGARGDAVRGLVTLAEYLDELKSWKVEAHEIA